MSVDAKYKTAATASGGGRDGRTALADGTMSFDLVVPKELGAPAALALIPKSSSRWVIPPVSSRPCARHRPGQRSNVRRVQR
jgi:hypothetical protein